MGPNTPTYIAELQLFLGVLLVDQRVAVGQTGRPAISAVELVDLACVLVRSVTLCRIEIPSGAPRAVSVSSRVRVRRWLWYAASAVSMSEAASRCLLAVNTSF